MKISILDRARELMLGKPADGHQDVTWAHCSILAILEYLDAQQLDNDGKRDCGHHPRTAGSCAQCVEERMDRPDPYFIRPTDAELEAAGATFAPICIGCGKPYKHQDSDLRCSSCVESGTGPEPAFPVKPIAQQAEPPGLWVAEEKARLLFWSSPEGQKESVSGVSFFRAGFEAGATWASPAQAQQVEPALEPPVEYSLDELRALPESRRPPAAHAHGCRLSICGGVFVCRGDGSCGLWAGACLGGCDDNRCADCWAKAQPAPEPAQQEAEPLQCAVKCCGVDDECQFVRKLTAERDEALSEVRLAKETIAMLDGLLKERGPARDDSSSARAGAVDWKAKAERLKRERDEWRHIAEERGEQLNEFKGYNSKLSRHLFARNAEIEKLRGELAEQYGIKVGGFARQKGSDREWQKVEYVYKPAHVKLSSGWIGSVDELESQPEPPAPREIRVGQTWRYRHSGVDCVVSDYSPPGDGLDGGVRLDGREALYREPYFLGTHTFVSEPPSNPPSESAASEGGK